MTEYRSQMPEESLSEDVQFRRMQLDWEIRKFRLKFIGTGIFVVLAIAILGTVQFGTSISQRGEVEFLLDRIRRETLLSRRSTEELRVRLDELEVRQRNVEAISTTLKQSFRDIEKVIQSRIEAGAKR